MPSTALLLPLEKVLLTQLSNPADPTLQSSRLNTPNEPAPEGLGAGPQPLGSLLKKGVGLTWRNSHVYYSFQHIYCFSLQKPVPLHRQ